MEMEICVRSAQVIIIIEFFTILFLDSSGKYLY